MDYNKVIEKAKERGATFVNDLRTRTALAQNPDDTYRSLIADEEVDKICSNLEKTCMAAATIGLNRAAVGRYFNLSIVFDPNIIVTKLNSKLKRFYPGLTATRIIGGSNTNVIISW